MTMGDISIDDTAFNLLQEQARKNRRTPEDEAAIMLQEALYWERYGQFEKPDDINQPRLTGEHTPITIPKR